jgi:hypothetical protein
MVRYAVVNRVDSIEGVKQFNLEGYKYDSKQSDESNLVFTRAKQAAGGNNAAKKRPAASTKNGSAMKKKRKSK